MFELKKIPEDFIVEEIPNREFTGGKYAVFLLQKRNYNTEDAVQRIADYLKVQRKNVCYAGAKDRNAITFQYVSIVGASKKDFSLKDIGIKYVGDTNKPISLGDLNGNKFTICVRNIDLTEVDIVSKSEFVNYFDEQRFSRNNAEIGKEIINRKYMQACKLLLEDDSKTSSMVKEVLDKNGNAYLNALKNIPRKTLMIYVHAFQSKIWNEVVERIQKEKTKKEESVNENKEKSDECQDEIPIPGFATELTDDIKQIYEDVLNEQKIGLRDFILRDFPEISLEGTLRPIKVNIDNLQIGELLDDDLNIGKKKVVLTFSLPKGAYATMVIKNLFVLKIKQD